MDWNEVLSSVLQAVLLVALPPMAVAVYKWISAQAEKLLAEAREWNPTVMDVVCQAARFAVAAAEQAGIGELIEDKKSYALEVAQLWLKEKGIVVDLKLVDAAIEAAVLDLKNGE